MTDLCKNITVSSQGTHHLRDGKPFYSQRFLKVMKYHEPGIAPVISIEGAYHISITGEPLYADRFQETFGFYDGYAAVKNDDGWFHINTKGKPLYDHRYDWCGNFQENKSVVNQKRSYFHINNDKQISFT